MLRPTLLFFIALGTSIILFLSLLWYFATPTKTQPVTAVESKIQTPYSVRTVIGKSVEGRAIDVYTFTSLAPESKHILFVGGIHGGYEWNSVTLAFKIIDELTSKKIALPNNVTVSIIPSLNPDGVHAVTKKEVQSGRVTEKDIPEEADTTQGRLNKNGVDLNRNFDCKWQQDAVWRGKKVSAGTEPFSEPEARALRDYVLATRPDAVVFWHSQANAVYASECEDGILPGTRTLMHSYAKAAGYKTVESFDAYPVTGDAEGWLASIGIPAITVELSSHESLDWEKNKKGIEATLEMLSK